MYKRILFMGIVVGIFFFLFVSAGVAHNSAIAVPGFPQDGELEERSPDAAEAVAGASTGTIGSFFDDFNTAQLNQRWIPPLDPDFFSYSYWNSILKLWVNSEGVDNTFLVNVPQDADFMVQTKVAFLPSENYQVAGITIRNEQNTKSVTLGREYCQGPAGCLGDAIYFLYYEGGVITGSRYPTDIGLTGDTAYLRIVRQGSSLVGFASPDGLTWTQIGTHTLGANPATAGLLAHAHDELASGIQAWFDYFLLSSPGGSTAFSYQGYLSETSSPVAGLCDFKFNLYGALQAGSQVGPELVLAGIPVAQGFFTASLDFGINTFTGAPRFLETAVRCPAGTGDFTLLEPRQPLGASPHALFAHQVSWTGLLDVPAGFADGTDDGSFTATGPGLQLTSGTLSLQNSYQLPQGCLPFQTPAWDPALSAWMCATAFLDFEQAQNIPHALELTPAGKSQLQPAPYNVWVVDLTTLANETEVIEHKVLDPYGHEIIEKLPGANHFLNFDVLCEGPCASLAALRTAVEDGELAAARQDATVVMYNSIGNEIQRWNLSACWPSKYVTELTEQRNEVRMRFTFACEGQEVIVTRAWINDPGEAAPVTADTGYAPAANELGDSSARVTLPPNARTHGVLQLGEEYTTQYFFADLLQLGSENEIIEHKVVDPFGHEIIQKLPGQLKFFDFDIVCTNSCPDLVTLRMLVLNGEVANARMDGTLKLLESDLASIYNYWALTACWPSAMRLVPSPDGTEALPVVTIACEDVEFVR